MLACPVSSDTVTYQIRDLGMWEASSINDLNQVVGGGDGRAILWQNDAAQDIFDGYASHINNLGQVLGRGSHAFVWDSGTITYLEVPAQPNIPYIGTYAYSINDAGQVVGGVYGASSPPQYKMNAAVIWENGSYRGLWSGPSSGPAQALDINNSGSAVGCDGRGYAGGIGGYLQYVQSCAYAINDSGWVVGSYGYGCPPSGGPIYGSYPDHAFLSRGSDWWDLGTLGGTTSCALGISNTGQVAGYAALADGSIHASLWQGGTVTDLGTLGGTGDSRACGINSSGWIVGNSNGHAVLWQPVVPEPSALLAVLCGIGGLALRRRGR